MKIEGCSNIRILAYDVRGKAMKIYIYESGHVDLEAPINMTRPNLIYLLNFLKIIFRM